ncbi:hypothetical protein BGZ47_008434 [Haplosporangium gracile]|nr:hypothetical protein BGZ47_008434 [Haplosporangium gracile]
MPVICYNIDFSKNQNLVKLAKLYTIIENYGISVIEYITPDVMSFIQGVGLRFTYDSTKPANDSSHIIKAEIQDRIKNWRRIVPAQTYSVVTMDFAMTGEDNILIKLH